MYIFQIIDGLTTGGAEQLQVTFANEAKKRGFKLAVISLDDGSNSQYLEQLRALDVSVYFFPTKRILDWKNLLSILRLIRMEKPDILHAHLTYAYIIGSLVAFFAGIPIVATLHSTGFAPNLGVRTAWAEKFALRHLTHQVIACGPAVAQHYKQTVKKDDSVLIIPNAVDIKQVGMSPQECEKMRRQIAGEVNRFVIISVGRLVPSKGYDDLLDAFSILRLSTPNAFLAIAGSGNYKSAMEQKIKDLKLSSSVNLLDWRTDIPLLLAVSDMFVLASHWEGLPIAVLEAMSAGLPVLATDVSDNAWAIGDTGITVPPHQPELLAAAMKELVSDPARCKTLGLAARIRIEEKFNPSDWFDKIVSAYQGVLN